MLPSDIIPTIPRSAYPPRTVATGQEGEKGTVRLSNEPERMQMPPRGKVQLQEDRVNALLLRIKDCIAEAGRRVAKLEKFRTGVKERIPSWHFSEQDLKAVDDELEENKKMLKHYERALEWREKVLQNRLSCVQKIRQERYDFLVRSDEEDRVLEDNPRLREKMTQSQRKLSDVLVEELSKLLDEKDLVYSTSLSHPEKKK